MYEKPNLSQVAVTHKAGLEEEQGVPKIRLPFPQGVFLPC